MRKDLCRYVKALLQTQKPITIAWDINEYDKAYIRKQFQNYRLIETDKQLTIEQGLIYYKVKFG